MLLYALASAADAALSPPFQLFQEHENPYENGVSHFVIRRWVTFDKE